MKDHNITHFVTHQLRQASDLSEFTHKEGHLKGKAIKNMPYWINLVDDWWFDFIRSDMDMVAFKQNMSNGHVYILDRVIVKT